MRADRLRAALADGSAALGTTIHLSDPAVVEAAAIAGYDWLSLIVEHAPFSVRDVHRHQLAADARGVTTLVHIASQDDGRILPLLNLGVGGIVGSHIETRQQAERLVEVTQFPPIGHRGAHASVRATGYGSVPYDEYLAEQTTTSSWASCWKIRRRSRRRTRSFPYLASRSSSSDFSIWPNPSVHPARLARRRS